MGVFFLLPHLSSAFRKENAIIAMLFMAIATPRRSSRTLNHHRQADGSPIALLGLPAYQLVVSKGKNQHSFASVRVLVTGSVELEWMTG